MESYQKNLLVSWLHTEPLNSVGCWYQDIFSSDVSSGCHVLLAVYVTDCALVSSDFVALKDQMRVTNEMEIYRRRRV
jgi:hypothetical protein